MAGDGSIINIAINKKARHDYWITTRYEVGLVLEGWEMKSIRAGRVQIGSGYIHLHRSEAFLSGVVISPLTGASSHVDPVPTRDRKCLLHRRELDKLLVATERKGLTLVPTTLYWRHGRVKLEIGLAQGKKKHDKRSSQKERQWGRQKQRLLKING
jgi:SsrA-binding protein